METVQGGVCVLGARWQDILCTEICKIVWRDANQLFVLGLRESQSPGDEEGFGKVNMTFCKCARLLPKHTCLQGKAAYPPEGCLLHHLYHTSTRRPWFGTGLLAAAPAPARPTSSSIQVSFSPTAQLPKLCTSDALDLKRSSFRVLSFKDLMIFQISPSKKRDYLVIQR